MKRFLSIVALSLAGFAAIISPTTVQSQVVNPSQPATGVPVAGTGIAVAGQTVSLNYGVANSPFTGNMSVGGTFSATGTVSGTGFSNLFAIPYPIGSTTPNTGAFTTLSTTNLATLASETVSGTTTNNGATILTGSVSGAGIDAYIAAKPVVQTVATVAALRAVSCVNGLLYADQGYYTIGGGGASTYVCNGADTTSTDNGVTILASANTNRLYLVQVGPVNVKQGGAKCDGSTDDTNAITNVLANVLDVYLPSGGCKITSTLTLRGGASLHGVGASSSLQAWGVNAITFTGSNIKIADIGLFSYTSGGTADPRASRGIYAAGTSGAQVNDVVIDNVFAQGWADAFYLAYTWSSTLHSVYTINTNNGVTLFGKSVGVMVSDSYLTVNSGNASIRTLNDTGNVAGEGLMVTNSTLTSGTYGIQAAIGFLSLSVSNNTIDLISGTGIDLTDDRSTHISNNWIYAANFGVKFNDLGSASPENSSVTNNSIFVTGTTSAAQCIYIGGANQYVAVTANALSYTVGAIGLFSNATQVTIADNTFVNTGTGADLYINASPSTNLVSNNIGLVTTVGVFQANYSYNTWSATDVSGAALTLTQTTTAVYTKVGRAVTASFDVTYPTTANASAASISVPFAPVNGSLQACSVGFTTIGASTMAAISSAGAATLTLYTEAGVVLTNANLSAKRVNVTCNYMAAS